MVSSSSTTRPTAMFNFKCWRFLKCVILLWRMLILKLGKINHTILDYYLPSPQILSRLIIRVIRNGVISRPVILPFCQKPPRLNAVYSFHIVLKSSSVIVERSECRYISVVEKVYLFYYAKKKIIKKKIFQFNGRG